MDAEFRAYLEQNLSKARSFYKSKHEFLRQKAKLLRDYYGISDIGDLKFANGHEVIDIRAAFIELRDSLKRLLWYWLVNFDKTLVSLTKFQDDIHASDADLANLTKSVEDLCQVNEWLEKVPFEKWDGSHGLVRSTLLQRKYPNGNIFHLPLTDAFAAIERDDVLGLDQQLRQSHSFLEVQGDSRQQLLFALLYLSAVTGTQRCTARLLSENGYIQDSGDHIHWLISKIGRCKKLQDRHTKAQGLTGSAIPGITIAKVTDQLAHIITTLGSKLEKAFQTEDSLGKYPLH